jgi:hypothetical protein
LEETMGTKTLESFDLLEWLNTGTIATREVNLYIDHETYQAWVEANKALKELEDNAPALSLSDGASRAELRERINELAEKLDDSKMVWTVRALSDTEIEQSLEAVPGPKLPIKPDGVMGEKLQAKWEARANQYGTEKVAADAERRLWVVQRATEKIITPAGEKLGVEISELKAMSARPHGAGWIAALYAAIEEATSQNATPDIP